VTCQRCFLAHEDDNHEKDASDDNHGDNHKAKNAGSMGIIATYVRIMFMGKMIPKYNFDIIERHSFDINASVFELQVERRKAGEHVHG